MSERFSNPVFHPEALERISQLERDLAQARSDQISAESMSADMALQLHNARAERDAAHNAAIDAAAKIWVAELAYMEFTAEDIAINILALKRP